MAGGSRSRSRSPGYRRSKMGKDRRRSRSRDKDRRLKVDRRRSRSRSPQRHRRSRSHSPRRRRSRSQSREDLRAKSKLEKVPNNNIQLLSKSPVTEADLIGKTDEEIEMITLMGFTTFDTTKGKHVHGNDSSAVNIIHKRKYRQYMNRKGGFNRPLDFVA